MSCERFEEERMDVAAGREPSPALRAHLEGCPDCRAGIDHERRALADVDRVLSARLSAMPSPDFAARVATRVRETEDRHRWRLAWMAAMAAAVGAAVVAGGLARRPDRAAPARLPEAATSAGMAPRQDAARPRPSDRPRTPPAPAAAPPRAVTARLAARAPRPAATAATEPLVLVPSGQDDALRRFVATLGLQRPAPPLLIAGTAVDGSVEPPPLLEIPAVTVEPLSDPAVSPERSQR